MTALQFSIGIVNDLVDAPRDVGRPDKPLVSGVASRAEARLVALGLAATGLLLGSPIGPAAPAPVSVLIALSALAVGLAYDLWFRGTPWSWLPFAIGIPLLPAYGWVGASGGLPAPFLVLLPTAVLAGAGLAIGNALGDLTRDREAGSSSVAVRLGRREAWSLHAGLLAIVSVLALGTLPQATPPTAWLLALLGVVVLGLGIALAWFAATRDRGWEIEAVGVAILAIAWLLGIDASGLLG